MANESNQEEKQELSIYKVFYFHGQKDVRTGKYPKAFVRVTALNPKEARVKAKKNGVTGNHRLVKWSTLVFEKKA